MMRVQVESLLKILHRVRGAAFAGRDDPEVIPRVGQSLGIIRGKLHGALKGLTRRGILVLIQADASNPVQCFGTLRIVAECLLERGFRLIQIPSLKKQCSVREIVATEVERVLRAGKRQRPRQSLGIGSGNMLKVVLHVLRDDWSLIHLDDLALRD